MGNRWRVAALIAVLVLAFTPACRRDPEAAKRRFLESGQQYFENGQYPQASIQFRNALEIDPRSPDLHYRLGLTYTRLRQWPEAYRALSTAAELDPSFVSARLALAQLLLMNQQTKEARAQADAVQALEPKNVRAQTLLAQSYMVENNFPRAIEEFEKAQRLAPREAILWVSSGFARVGAKQYASAEKDFRQAIELDRSSAEAYRNLANLFRLTGRDREVEPLLRQALERNPRSRELHLNLADFYWQQRRVKHVEDLFATMKNRAGDFQDLRFELGEFWMWRNEPGRAVEEYQALLAEKPDLLVQKKLISAYITLGKWDEAERLNQQLLARNPKDLEGRVFRGALKHLHGDSAAAVEELQAALKEEPQSLFTQYYLGLALMGVGKSQEAEAAFVECVRLNENFGNAFQKLAEIRLQDQDWRRATEYSRKVMALMPQSPDGYLLLARSYLLKGEAQKAEQVLGEVAKKMPRDSAAVQELLGEAYIAQGKVEAGVREYEQVWAHTENPVQSVNRFADALSARGRLDVAIRQVQQLNARQVKPGYYEILARLYLRKGDLAAAEAACHQALSLDRSSWVAHLHLGEVYERLHRPSDALSQYDEIIRTQPKLISPYILAGDIRLRQGNLDQARAYYEAARKRQPEDAFVLHSLARLWAEEGTKLLEATALVQGLQQKFPDNPYLSDTLAWIYYQKGMYSEARPLLKRCIEQKPGNASFHYHLGLTYWKLGQVSLSRQALQTALRLGLESERWEAAAREVLTSLDAEVR